MKKGRTTMRTLGKMTSLVTLLLCCCLVLTVGAPLAGLAAEPKYEFHLPCADPFWGEGGIWAMIFARSVEEMTGGAVKIILHLNGEWGGSEEDYVRNVQLGALDMALTATSNMGTYTTSLYTYDVPFLFKSLPAQIASTFEDRTKLTPMVAKMLAQASKDAGFEVLSISPLGRRDVFARKPVKSPAELKGIKMRTMGSRPQVDGFKAVGTVVTPLPYGECYTALQMGTIDAMENSPSIYFENRYYEVAPYWLGTSHYTITMAIIMDKGKWARLPEQYRSVMRECAISSGYIAAQWGMGASEMLLQNVLPEKTKQMVHLTDKQREEMRAAALPKLLDTYGNNIGMDVLKELAKTDRIIADWLAKK
ncbi:MAG: TRAP transporter substrate-binding protein [Firmicutes bacterium]|jgi:TRAP-type C4-dicarboxylate transport system substrate-binding protein|nr:TRAP transporter substrate-binding protein [Bacillota bacterium]